MGGLKRKRASVSSVVNKRAKRRKEPAANKKQGRGLKKKVRKSRPKNKKSNKKKKGGGEISRYFLIKTRVLSQFYLVVCLYPWRTHLLIGLSKPLPQKRKKKKKETSINHGSRK